MGEKPTRLKVHRYAVTLDGNPVTMLRIRPGGTELFATNYFHGVWHILSDEGGVRLLGRLCWALAYQRRPGTFFVLDSPELVTNPFDADPSNTIVLTNPSLGLFNAAMANASAGCYVGRRLLMARWGFKPPGWTSPSLIRRPFRRRTTRLRGCTQSRLAE